jgi:hypothetical protein
VEADGGAYRGPVAAGHTVVQASSASDRWVLEVDGRRAERTDAYGWANAFATGDGPEGGEAVLSYRTPPVRHLLLGVQGALWLLALVVVVRMRFGSEAPSPAAPFEAPEASGEAEAESPPDDEPVPEEVPSPGREPEPVPAGAPT